MKIDGPSPDGSGILWARFFGETKDRAYSRKWLLKKLFLF